MRGSTKLGLAGLLGGAATWALRGDARRLVARVTGTTSRERGEQATPTSDEFPREVDARATQQGADEQPSPADPDTEFHVDPEEVLARRTERADGFVDETADAAGLVAAERDALTVPGEEGEGHRRRDQTAGEAAQEIAAAQVRERRNGEAAWDELDG